MNRYKGLVKSDEFKYNTSLPFDVLAESKTKAIQQVCNKYDIEPSAVHEIKEFKTGVSYDKT